MTRPEWRTTGLWSWRDRRESAYFVEKLDELPSLGVV
jgi:hypothetical protein